MSARNDDFIDRAVSVEQRARTARLKGTGPRIVNTETAYQLTINAATGISASSGNAWVPGLQVVQGTNKIRLSYLQLQATLAMGSIRNNTFSTALGLWYAETSALWRVRGTARLTSGGAGLSDLRLDTGDNIRITPGMLGSPDSDTQQLAGPVAGRIDRLSGAYGVSGSAYFLRFSFVLPKASYPALSDVQAIGAEHVYFQGPMDHAAV